MCKAPIDTQTTKDVVIVGAGPAGLLAAILLLRRARCSEEGPMQYRVTLVDPGTDYGKLSTSQLQRHRSWMIGLSAHGLAAIRTVPGLYEEYIRGLGIDIQQAVFGVSKRIKFTVDARDILPDDSAFTVDRNHICAALSRYVNENYGESVSFVSHYHTRALYVDGDNKCVVARHTSEGGETSDLSIDYDILLGCDGIRSVVRNAFMNRHREFEFELRGTFGKGKSIHVSLPENVAEGTFMFINESLPGCGSFILPETGKKLNVGIGCPLNKPFAPELESDDPRIVADYFRRHWHAFDIDADEAGRQWVAQSFFSVQQVHCNFYHSEPLAALLIGDAAHATSPQIGQGMNTALADAAALDRLLDEHKDDWAAVLPRFSEERVKEGNALTDLSFYTFSLKGSQQLRLMVGQVLRRTLNKLCPRLFDPDPMDEVSKGLKLSEAYHRMSKLGVIQRVRSVNDGIMREHFEKSVGMVREEATSRLGNLLVYGAPVVIAASVGGFFYAKA